MRKNYLKILLGYQVVILIFNTVNAYTSPQTNPKKNRNEFLDPWEGYMKKSSNLRAITFLFPLFFLCCCTPSSTVVVGFQYSYTKEERSNVCTILYFFQTTFRSLAKYTRIKKFTKRWYSYNLYMFWKLHHALFKTYAETQTRINTHTFSCKRAYKDSIIYAHLPFGKFT